MVRVLLHWVQGFVAKGWSFRPQIYEQILPSVSARCPLLTASKPHCDLRITFLFLCKKHASVLSCRLSVSKKVVYPCSLLVARLACVFPLQFRRVYVYPLWCSTDQMINCPNGSVGLRQFHFFFTIHLELEGSLKAEGVYGWSGHYEFIKSWGSTRWWIHGIQKVIASTGPRTLFTTALSKVSTTVS